MNKTITSCLITVVPPAYVFRFIRTILAEMIRFFSQGNHTRLLQLTGRWQYDGIMRSALRSIKSNNVDFLNQIRYFSIKIGRASCRERV